MRVAVFGWQTTCTSVLLDFHSLVPNTNILSYEKVSGLVSNCLPIGFSLPIQVEKPLISNDLLQIIPIACGTYFKG